MSFTLHHADLRDVLPTLADKSIDVTIFDPPYSAHVHKSIRGLAARGSDDGLRVRTTDLGFDSLTAPLRRFCASECARLTRRWVAVFSDVESCHLWRRSFEAAGLEYVRTCQWIKLNGAPQFSGDRPAVGFETIVLAHAPGKKRWNGGGKAGSYPRPIVNSQSGRVHPSQKPISLMLDLVDDFTEPGEVVLDPFAGSGTTGVACLQRGRNFVGVERMEAHVATARERLEAADQGLSVKAARAGQMRLV